MRALRFLTVTLALLLVAGLCAAPQPARAAVFVNITVAPPVLPVYEPPICPGPGYLWTPGYWAWGDDGYYWVPGAWVVAPQPGFLWTPGYWGWNNGVYLWHAGYWGPHIGFYGGVNYGFGYFGVGFVGGRWNGGVFAYNTAIFHVGPSVRNVYVDRTVVVRNVTVNRYSFNGPGGINRQPVAAERVAERDHHFEPLASQTEHQRMAAQDRSLAYSANHGHPTVAAVSRPMNMQNHEQVMHNAVPARGAAPMAANTRPNSFNNNSRPEARPEQQQRPAMNEQQRPQPQARPEMQSRPQYQPQQSRPQPQAHPQSRPAPAAHSAPAPHSEGHEERPH